jgi:hypothetical protein
MRSSEGNGKGAAAFAEHMIDRVLSAESLAFLIFMPTVISAMFRLHQSTRERELLHALKH